MITFLLIKTDHCSPINSYAIFSQFTQYTWTGMSPSAPNTTFATWIQQFIDFGAVSSTDFMVSGNLEAFSNLCATVSECGIDSIGTSCVITHPELASSGQAAFPAFFICLITVIALRCLIELSRMLLVLWSILLCRIKFADYGALFIGRSVFAPLLYFRADTRNEFSDMLIDRKVPLTHHQFILELITSALLTSIPLLASSLFYITVVAQTGVTASTLISLMFTGFKACVLIARALHVWIQSLMDARSPSPAEDSSPGQDAPSAGLELTNDLLSESVVKSVDLVSIELSDTANPFVESQPVSDRVDHSLDLPVQSSVEVRPDSFIKESNSNEIVTPSAQFDDISSSVPVQKPTAVVSGSDFASSEKLSAPPPSRRRMSSIVTSEQPVVESVEKSAASVENEDSAVIDASETVNDVE
jgi:hypothetical protein